jgi:ABC-2 type transport system permease protein
VRAVAPLAGLLVVTVGVIAVSTSASGSGIDKAKLDRSLATSYAHIYRMQTQELHRPDVTEAKLRTSADCDKGGSLVDDVGAGNDWRCVVSWRLPGSTVVGQAIYQLDVTPDGRYVADGDGPQQVNGFFQVHTASSGDVPNPLWQFDGTVDLLTPISSR